MFNPNIKQGQDLTNKDLCDLFKFGPQGGMRKSNSTNSLVLISNHIKSIYEDRWIGDVFHYTGMGMEGDQSLSFMQNNTLSNSLSNGISLHLFEVFQEKSYTYIGPVKLSDKPYQEMQPDQHGANRHVWMFPLIISEGELPSLPKDKIEILQKSKEKKAKNIDDKELDRRAKGSSKKAGRRSVTSTQFERNIWVSEYIKRKAKGVCQLCNNNAPFNNSAGKPYLETHHIIWLSEGGEDSIENSVALCPNCHRKMHILNLKEDRRLLLNISN
jgi:5-methylcytosine-specific restriction enzyme A